jgi:hypothetical protein
MGAHCARGRKRMKGRVTCGRCGRLDGRLSPSLSWPESNPMVEYRVSTTRKGLLLSNVESGEIGKRNNSLTPDER